MAKTIEMTSGSSLKLIVKFAIPLFLGNIFQQLYNTVDSVVVGRFIGKEALAAVGSSGSLINLIISAFMGLSVGASVVIAQSFGAGRNEEVSDEAEDGRRPGGGDCAVQGLGVLARRPRCLSSTACAGACCGTLRCCWLC